MNTGQTVYEQLQEIKEKIADKTLSFGCIYEFGGDKFPICIHSIKALKNNVGTYKVIGHPTSLARVLSALGDREYCYQSGCILEVDEGDNDIGSTFSFGDRICDRKLLTDTGSDALLEDQSDHTIEALHKLLVRK